MKKSVSGRGLVLAMMFRWRCCGLPQTFSQTPVLNAPTPKQWCFVASLRRSSCVLLRGRKGTPSDHHHMVAGRSPEQCQMPSCRSASRSEAIMYCTTTTSQHHGHMRYRPDSMTPCILCMTTSSARSVTKQPHRVHTRWLAARFQLLPSARLQLR